MLLMTVKLSSQKYTQMCKDEIKQKHSWSFKWYEVRKIVTAQNVRFNEGGAQISPLIGQEKSPDDLFSKENLITEFD